MNENIFLPESMPGKKVRVLIVEDSGIVAMQIKHLLIKMNYSVVRIASSGEEAIEVAGTQNVDLVLMDIKLDGRIDGIDAAKLLRVKYDLPVIFITAYSDPETFNRAKQTGPFGYIIKPFESKELQTVIEITLYKHSVEKQLKQSEELYRTLVQTTHDGIAILYNGKMEFVNEAFCKMIGCRQNEITGVNFKEFIDDQDLSAEDLESISLNNPCKAEYEIILKHNVLKEKIFANIHLNTAVYQNRKVVVCTIKDITEAKKAREVLLRNEENLRAKLDYIISTEDKLQRIEGKNEAILSAISDSMFQVNGDGKYLCLKHSNISQDYFWSGSLMVLREVKNDFPEEIAQLIIEHVGITLQTGQPRNFEFLYDSSDKKHFYEAKVTRIDDSESLVMIGDITEKKNSEEAIIKAKEIAENSDRLKSEFLAQMSHEIRTPINAILSFSSLLKEELENKLSGGLSESFKIIDRAGRRLIRTIDEILEMSQLQTGNFEINTVAVDLAKEVLENLLSEYCHLAKEKQIELKFENKITDEAIVNADRHMINQIFSNIIDNALKYTPEGRVEVIQYKNEEEKICVEVKDTGIGISEDYLTQLFTPFTQEEMGYTRRYEGNGLGLALVKRYAELNNATLSVASKKGEGSVFTVKFERPEV